MTKEDHWRRSENLADSMRRYLIAINTGGVGITFAVASAMVDNKIPPGWAWPPVLFFIGGLGLVLGSLFLAKLRALDRFKAPDPDKVEFPWYMHSQPWEIASAVTFALGATIGLWQLSEIALPGNL